MPWQAWILVVLFALNALVVVGRIGEPRKALTREDAVAVVIANSLFIWAIVSLT
jgi:hypothetical protein